MKHGVLSCWILTLVKDHEVAVSGHLIGQTSPSGLMNIHAVPAGGVGAFINALFHSTPVYYICKQYPGNENMIVLIGVKHKEIFYNIIPSD